jgi:hypothetical protein
MRCIRDGVEYCTIQVAYIEAPTRRWCESTVLVFSHHHVSHNDEGSKLCIMMFRPLRGSIFWVRLLSTFL